MIRMPGRSFGGALPALSREQSTLRDELQRHVQKLGGDIGEHNVYIPKALRAAADYCEEQLRAAGLTVTRQSFTVLGDRKSVV